MLAALLLAACATTPEPTGPMTVIISNSFNILTGGVLEAPVHPDGSFANGMRQDNSSVALFGQVTPAKNGSYEVTFNYQCTIARTPSAVDSKSLQATVITDTNQSRPIGDIMTKLDGNRHTHAADNISLELRALPVSGGEWAP